MKNKNRAIAILLSVVMVLTFMPMMAFAEDQNTKKATALEYKGNLEYEPAGVYDDGEAYDAYFSGWDEPGNKVIITWDDKTTSTFVCKKYNIKEEDGSKATAVGYFPENVTPHVVPVEYGGTDADNDVYFDRDVDNNSGKITISYYYDRYYTDADGNLQTEGEEISTSVQGIKPVSLSYEGPALTYPRNGVPSDVYPYQEGAKIIIAFSGGTTKTALCKKWSTTVNGKKHTECDYLFEGVEPNIVISEDGYPYVSNSSPIYFDFDNATKEGLPIEYKGVKGSIPVAEGGYEISAPDRMWAGESGYGVEIEGAAVESVKSSNKAVLVAKRGFFYDENDVKTPFYYLTAKKAGKATITVKYSDPDGKTGTLEKSIKVKKYPNPIKSLKVNGKKVTVSKNKYMYSKGNFKSTKAIVKVTLNKGWKIADTWAYGYTKSGKTVKIKITKKMLTKGTVIKKLLKKYQTIDIGFTMIKGDDDISYNINLYR